MPTNKKALPQQLSFQLPTVAAGTGATIAIFNPSFSGEIVSVNVANQATLDPAATNYTTLALIDNTTTTHTLASLNTNTGGTTLTTAVFSAMTVAATNTDKRFNAGDAIIFTKVDTGTGQAMTTPTLWIEYIAGTYDS